MSITTIFFLSEKATVQGSQDLSQDNGNVQTTITYAVYAVQSSDSKYSRQNKTHHREADIKFSPFPPSISPTLLPPSKKYSSRPKSQTIQRPTVITRGPHTEYISHPFIHILGEQLPRSAKCLSLPREGLAQDMAA